MLYAPGLRTTVRIKSGAFSCFISRYKNPKQNSRIIREFFASKIWWIQQGLNL